MVGKLGEGAIGFGLPGMPVKNRLLNEEVKAAPFFYFENIACMTGHDWDTIQKKLFGIEPEIVDAIHFSPCRRPRGYIHSLPLEGRKKMIADPPMTITELMPHTKPFWPEWDSRKKLNCINTKKVSKSGAKKVGLPDGISLQINQELTVEKKKQKLKTGRKMNLVWTSPNVATPIEATEIEAKLGFDRDHSRPCFYEIHRYKALGNSFSVYAVAYHFPVLKALYPNVIKVLSLFSGIGGAEVTLHKVGIKLNVVVSVEIEETSRRCLQSRWTQTGQTGHLDENFHDVRDLSTDVLTRLVKKYRGFDLIVGGSPCNNISRRTGLNGKNSKLFYHFPRIVSTVRELSRGL